MAPDALLRILIKYASLRRSFRDDPLGTMKRIEERFNIKLPSLSPGAVELVASMSDEEFELLTKMSERATKLGLQNAVVKLSS